MDHFDSSVTDMTWGGIQGNQEIQIYSFLVRDAYEISLESLEYLLRFVFFGRLWIPSGMKLIKVVLSFFSLCAASFYWVFLFVSSLVYDSAYSFWKGKNWAEYRAHSFIWEPQFLATVVVHNSNFCLPYPVKLIPGPGCYFLCGSVPCTGHWQVPCGEKVGIFSMCSLL